MALDDVLSTPSLLQFLVELEEVGRDKATQRHRRD